MQTLILTSASGMCAELLDLGATVQRLVVPVRPGGEANPDDAARDVLLGLGSEAEHHASQDYVGVSIGRYANRIGGGRFTLDGVEHRLPVNDHGNTLHGGAGFDERTWTVVDHQESSLTLALVSDDGDQGFPGRVEVTARFELVESAGLPTMRTTYSAQTSAPTPVSLTSHLYLDLDGATPGPADPRQRLDVPAGRYLPVDEVGLPTGEVAPVEATAYDLRGGRALGDLPPIDHSYVVDGEGLRQVAEMTSSTGDLTMELWSDQPGLHVYTGSKLVAGDLEPFAGVALEPQHFPDSVHHPEWPSTVLRPGETYAGTSELRFRS